MSGARRAGKIAERAVEDYLASEGFTVLARNLRLGPLEIDLVAQKGPLAVLVEVRTRGPGSFQRALASIDAKKRATLLRAADRLWREHLSARADVERLRIDVAAVTFRGDVTEVEYFPAALTASPGG